MYCIQATITETLEDGTITRQVPTFYLNENVQMISNAEQAEKIAKAILSVALRPNCEISVFAQKI